MPMCGFGLGGVLGSHIAVEAPRAMHFRKKRLVSSRVRRPLTLQSGSARHGHCFSRIALGSGPSAKTATRGRRPHRPWRVQAMYDRILVPLDGIDVRRARAAGGPGHRPPGRRRNRSRSCSGAGAAFLCRKRANRGRSMESVLREHEQDYLEDVARRATAAGGQIPVSTCVLDGAVGEALSHVSGNGN